MLQCRHCQSEVLDEDNFCPTCEQQVRCTNAKCGSDRIGKTKCLRCGAPLVAQEQSQAQMNEYHYEFDQKSDSEFREHIKLLATNEAIENAAPLFGGRGSLNRLKNQTAKVNQVDSRALPSPPIEEVVEGDIETPDAMQDSPAPAQDGNLSADAAQFFEKDEGNEQLFAKVTDYNGKSRRMTQQRFMLMYCWAYQKMFGKAVPSKDHLIEATKRSGIYDPHIPEYFDQMLNKLLMPIGTGFKPNPEGDKLVLAIIEELKGSEDKSNSPKAKAIPRKKRSTLNSKDQQQVDRWVSTPVDIGGFDVRTLKTSADQAMFILWILTKKLNVQAVKPKLAYALLTGKYTTVPTVEPKPFTNALSHLDNAGVFSRNSAGLYCLTPTAEAMVESWIAQAKPQQVSTEGSDGGTEGISNGGSEVQEAQQE